LSYLFQFFAEPLVPSFFVVFHLDGPVVTHVRALPSAFHEELGVLFVWLQRHRVREQVKLLREVMPIILNLVDDLVVESSEPFLHLAFEHIVEGAAGPALLAVEVAQTAADLRSCGHLEAKRTQTDFIGDRFKFHSYVVHLGLRLGCCVLTVANERAGARLVVLVTNFVDVDGLLGCRVLLLHLGHGSC